MGKYLPTHRAERTAAPLAKFGVPAAAVAATTTLLSATAASATGANNAASSGVPTSSAATFGTAAAAPAAVTPVAAAAPAARPAAAAPKAVGVPTRVMKINRAVDVANNQIGTPYVYGGMSPRGFDCSGLVAYSYKKAGISLPHQSGAIAGKTRRISKSSLQHGDLMFFTNGSRVYHVAIFLRWTKNGPLMVHSPRPGERVSKTVPWTSSWFAGTLR